MAEGNNHRLSLYAYRGNSLMAGGKNHSPLCACGIFGRVPPLDNGGTEEAMVLRWMGSGGGAAAGAGRGVAGLVAGRDLGAEGGGTARGRRRDISMGFSFESPSGHGPNDAHYLAIAHWAQLFLLLRCVF